MQQLGFVRQVGELGHWAVGAHAWSSTARFTVSPESSISWRRIGWTIASRLRLCRNNSTTHRLLTTMQQLGFVRQVGELGHWAVGAHAFDNRQQIAALQKAATDHEGMRADGPVAQLADLADDPTAASR
jgi:DNA-binding IclR family transcriptional regulator